MSSESLWPRAVATAWRLSLDFSCWVPEGFGTGDCLIVADKLLHIIDFKYGQGAEFLGPVLLEQAPHLVGVPIVALLC